MFWDDKFLPLSVYNGEVSRGILHTAEYKGKMEVMQKAYYSEMKEWALEKGWVVI